MSIPQVHIISITRPITATGKIFQGDYAQAPKYISQIQQELEREGVSFLPNKVMGVYYDNPQETKTEDLKSFQGVFTGDEKHKAGSSLTSLSLSGNYLYVKVSGDPLKSIYEGYGALFAYIQENNIILKSPAGYQVSTFENEVITTEIYMELAD